VERGGIGPVLAAVDRSIDAAAGTAAPHRREDDGRVRRVHGNRSDRSPFEQRVAEEFPGGARVERLEHAGAVARHRAEETVVVGRMHEQTVVPAEVQALLEVAAREPRRQVSIPVVRLPDAAIRARDVHHVAVAGILHGGFDSTGCEAEPDVGRVDRGRTDRQPIRRRE
jgi:hypothetical protein